MVEIIASIRNRKSARHYDGRKLSQGEIDQLLEAFRWAPSSLNRQPWRVIVAQGQPASDAWNAALSETNRAWATAAPLKLVVLGNPEEQPDQHGQHRWLVDCGLALGQMLIQACAMGLSVRAMVGFDEERARAGFAIPAPFRVVVLVAAGYPGRVETLAPEVQEKERRPRVRKSIADIAFADRFGAAWTA